MENDGYKCDTVSGAKQSGEHGQNLCVHRRGDDIAVTDRRESDDLIIQIVDQRAASSRGWGRHVWQQIILEGKEGQDTAEKKRPEKVPNGDENRFSSRLLQEVEQRAQA